VGVAAGLAPFVAIGVWFLVIPPAAYVIGEVLERLMSGGSEALSVHAAREPGLLLARAIQVPFGAVAYAVARLLLAAARAISAKICRLVPAAKRQRQADAAPISWIAPTRWTCLVGARGLRGPPVVLVS
jgi:hypothetical protein